MGRKLHAMEGVLGNKDTEGTVISAYFNKMFPVFKLFFVIGRFAKLVPSYINFRSTVSAPYWSLISKMVSERAAELAAVRNSALSRIIPFFADQPLVIRVLSLERTSLTYYSIPSMN